MSKESHVVRLSSVDSSPQASSFTSSSSSALVSRIADLATKELTLMLDKMLDSTDDKLFDLADKSNEVTFFSAMRQLRIKRKGLVNAFKQEFSEKFYLSLAIQSNEANDENVEFMSMDNLVLVQEDELEEDIALDAMVNKARADCSKPLEHLIMRFDVVCPAVEVTEANNPVDPRYIAEAFRVASKHLDLDIKSRLIIYKMFERFVINSLEDFYNEINAEFAETGVLPDLHKIKSRRRSSERNESNNVSKEEVREEVFNTLRELLGDRKVHYPDAKPVVNSEQLVSALTDLQRDQGFSAKDLSTPEQVKEVLGNFLPQVGAVNGGTIGNINDDVIDIVTMLFDFILDDKNLHNDIKALLARLQIPMLKTGLVDRTFFSDRNHPARVLLNELSKAGVGWTPNPNGAQDPLVAKITQIVDRVQESFKDDVGLFKELLDDFANFKENDQRREKILEKRMREAEEGKAKSESARQVVNSQISRMCHSRVIPPSVKMIFKEVWNQVLFLERLKPNNQDGWEKAVKVAEFLVWSVQPKVTEESKAKLRKVMPSLVNNLKRGMARVVFDRYRGEELLTELRSCHQQVLSLKEEVINTTEPPENASLPIHASSAQSENQRILEAHLKKIGQKAKETDVEELTLPTSKTGSETEVDKEWEIVEPLENDDPIYETVDALQAGTWVEMIREGFESQRCKLAAFIASSCKYIFVNRTGMKVVELTRDKLAHAFKKEKFAVLDDAALFDRALESVITNLRSMKGA